MALLRRNKSYDRHRILGDAATARKKGKTKKALGLYQQVLEHEPNNGDLHRRVAPLLAETKKLEESLVSYGKAADNLVRQGFVEQATGLYREALGYMPREADLWVTLAEMQVKRNQKPDAIASLVQGRSHFKKRSDAGQAIRLLQCARGLDPYAFAANYDLACLLARARRKDRAIRILEQLASRHQARPLCRARGKLFRLSPTPPRLWAWLRALFLGR